MCEVAPAVSLTDLVIGTKDRMTAAGCAFGGGFVHVSSSSASRPAKWRRAPPARRLSHPSGSTSPLRSLHLVGEMSARTLRRIRLPCLHSLCVDDAHVAVIAGDLAPLLRAPWCAVTTLALGTCDADAALALVHALTPNRTVATLRFRVGDALSISVIRDLLAMPALEQLLIVVDQLFTQLPWLPDAYATAGTRNEADQFATLLTRLEASPRVALHLSGLGLGFGRYHPRSSSARALLERSNKIARGHSEVQKRRLDRWARACSAIAVWRALGPSPLRDAAGGPLLDGIVSLASNQDCVECRHHASEAAATGLVNHGVFQGVHRWPKPLDLAAWRGSLFARAHLP